MMDPIFRRMALLLPAGTIFVLCFALPATYFFIVSFWRVRSYQLTVDATLDNYVAVFTNYSDILVSTLLTAAMISTLVTVVAGAFAYMCRFQAKRYAPILLFGAMFTLFGGYLTKIYMWRTILGSSGILNSALVSAGIIDEPFSALLFNPVSVVITLGHYLLPFAILPLYGALHNIHDGVVEAARDLGASETRILFQVVLPQCQAGLITAFALTFLFAVGDFATAGLVGGPQGSLMGVFIQGQFTQRLNQPMGAAMAFTMIACSLMVILFVYSTLRRGLRYR